MQKLSGILIFLSLITSIFAYFVNDKVLIFSGVFIWFAFLLLFSSLKNKKLLSLILLMSFFFYLLSFYNDYEIPYEKVFTINQYLISLLIAVSFLKIVSKPKIEDLKHLPRGQKSFFKTYLGLHFFGAVINLSALLLIADKFYKKSKLSKLQLILLTRAFSSDAYWSPFFVAFGVALTYAPNLSYFVIFLSGIILASFAFLITLIEIKLKYNFEDFEGYPINFSTSYIPILLSICVLLVYNYNQDLKIIVLIASFSLLLTVIILPIKKGLKTSLFILKNFIIEELPLMKLELSLFIVAGMFGVLVSSFIDSISLFENFEMISSFTYKSAALMLLVFIFLAFIGIHPVISISIFASTLNDVNHTLLAMTFLMAWATTVSTSPFSGLNLTLQSRYKIKPKEIIVVNIKYIIIMYLFSVLILYIFANSFAL